MIDNEQKDLRNKITYIQSYFFDESKHYTKICIHFSSLKQQIENTKSLIWNKRIEDICFRKCIEISLFLNKFRKIVFFIKEILEMDVYFRISENSHLFSEREEGKEEDSKLCNTSNMKINDRVDNQENK